MKLFYGGEQDLLICFILLWVYSVGSYEIGMLTCFVSVMAWYFYVAYSFMASIIQQFIFCSFIVVISAYAGEVCLW